MRNTHDAFEHLVDMAFNGTPPDTQRALDEHMHSDHVLRNAVFLQRQVDDSLRRLFVPPAGIPLPLAECDTVPATVRHRIPWRRCAAIAAALAIVALGAWSAWLHVRLSNLQELAGLDLAYEQIVARERPVVAVADAAALVSEIESRFGIEVQVATPSPDVTLLAVLGCSTLSGRTLSVLAQAGDEYVVLLIDTRGREARPHLPIGSGLYVHRARAGSLMLFEISPRPTPLLAGLVTGGRRIPPCAPTIGPHHPTTSSNPPHGP